MRFNPKLCYLFFSLSVLIACSKDEDEPPVVEKRTIETKVPPKIGYFEATLEGEWTNFRKDKIYDFGFVWSTAPNPTTSLDTKKHFGEDTVPGKITYQLTGLKNGTVYYYRAFAIIDSGVRYGNEVSFSTLTSPWKQTTSFAGTGRSNPISFTIGSKGYIGLGLNLPTTYLTDLWEFNPADKSWTKKANFPGTPRAVSASFVIGNKAYVATGLCSCKDVWEYDPAVDKWTQKADFPIADLYYTAFFSINGKGYLATGINSGSLLTDVWEYDPTADKWTKKANYPGTPVDAAMGFAIGGKGYVAGGNQAAGNSVALWEYDPAVNKWTQRKNVPYATENAVAFTINAKGYLGMGWNGGSQFWEYDPVIDNWKKHLDFEGGYREGAHAFVINNTAYVGLGTSAWTVYPTAMWEFTPAQ